MNIEQKYDIFISYRRATGANAARMMQLALTARGYSVFLDYDSLEDGKFNEAIYSAIDSCEVFILMMTGGALDRCMNPGDWVRLEIQRAIEQKKNIVPVVPSDQTWSFPDSLPQELSSLRNVHVSKLDMEELFNESIVKIETARFPRELRERTRNGQSGTGAGVGMAEMFRMFAQAKRERVMIGMLPDEEKLTFAAEIRMFEDDLAAAEEARACSANDVAMSLVAQALKTVVTLKEKIEAERRREPKPGDEMTIILPGGVPMTFCWCPSTTSEAWKKISGGEDFFWMGSPESEPDRRSDEVRHRVKLTQGFWMGKYEVTQRQWEGVMGESPSNFKDSDRPIEQVSWDGCQEFVRKINAAGQFCVSLPTEAQWEYACRAGTTTPFNFGSALNGDKANCDGNYPYGMSSGRYRQATSPVGEYAPNGWGLYDMHGNVSEWCQDWCGIYAGDATDPTGPVSGMCRVFRGGGWGNYARSCRSAKRDMNPPCARCTNLGLRLVCSLSAAS